MRGLHPLARLWIVVAVSLGLALYAQVLMPSLLFLSGILLLCDRPDRPVLWRSLRRIRWLLLATVLLHAYLTPGPLLWPVLGALSPAREGFQEGLMRALVLTFMVLWSLWLMKGVSPGYMAQALARLLLPLAWLGFPVGRLALRLSLALENVELLGGRARSLREALNRERPPAGLREGLQIRAQVLLRLFKDIELAEPPATRTPDLPLARLARRDYLVLLLVYGLLGLNLLLNGLIG